MKTIIILGALIILFFVPLIINPTTLTRRGGDFTDLVILDYLLIKESILNFHQIPLWNPYVFSGLPEISNPQSPLLYPPNIIALFLDIDLAVVILVILHLIISSCFMYKIGRIIFKWDWLQSVALSLAFSVSPFLWSKFSVGHISMFFAMCLVAPILYFSLRIIKQRGFKDILLLSFLLGIQYLNYPTIWYYTIFFGMIAIAILFIKTKGFLQIARFLVALTGSLLLISPILFIHLKSGQFITRSTLTINDLTIPIWSITRFLKSVFLPPILVNDPETEVWLYPSIVLIFLSFFALFKLRARMRFLALTVGVLVILITLGSRTPFFKILVDFVPGFSYLRVVTRDWFVLTTLLAFLASFSLSYIKPKWRWIVAGVLIADLVINSQLALWHIPNGMKAEKGSMVADLITESTSQYRYYCTSYCMNFAESTEKKILRADGYHLVILKSYEKVLSEAGGFAPIAYNGYIPSYMVADAQPSAEKLGKLSVKWVISNKNLVDPGFAFIKEQGGYMLYENLKALERIRFKNRQGKVEILEDKPNSIIVKTFGKADRLIVADNHFIGWEVFVDKSRGELMIEDGWAKSVDLDDGEHRVQFNFNPYR